jgi:hypothetical protein
LGRRARALALVAAFLVACYASGFATGVLRPAARHAIDARLADDDPFEVALARADDELRSGRPAAALRVLVTHGWSELVLREGCPVAVFPPVGVVLVGRRAAFAGALSAPVNALQSWPGVARLAVVVVMFVATVLVTCAALLLWKIPAGWLRRHGDAPQRVAGDAAMLALAALLLSALASLGTWAMFVLDALQGGAG